MCQIFSSIKNVNIVIFQVIRKSSDSIVVPTIEHIALFICLADPFTAYNNSTLLVIIGFRNLILWDFHNFAEFLFSLVVCVFGIVTHADIIPRRNEFLSAKPKFLNPTISVAI